MSFLERDLWFHVATAHVAVVQDQCIFVLYACLPSVSLIGGAAGYLVQRCCLQSWASFCPLLLCSSDVAKEQIKHLLSELRLINVILKVILTDTAAIYPFA